MASTFTPSLRAELQGTGENSGTWGILNNSNYLNVFESAIAGVANIAMPNSDYTLTTANNAPDEARRAVLQLTGSLTAGRSLIVPNVTKTYTVVNGTNQTVTVKTASGSGVAVPAGATTKVWCDAINVRTGMSWTPAFSAPTISATTVNAPTVNATSLVATGTVTAPTVNATTGAFTDVTATTVTSPTVSMSTNFLLSTVSGNTRLTFAFNDYIGYDVALNQYRFHIAGAEALRISQTELLYYGRRMQPRAGEIILWAVTTQPDGWLPCDGAARSRTTYPDLFALIGTTYGSGDGSTTFNVPNLPTPNANMRYIIRW